MITKPLHTILSDETDNDQYGCMCRQEQQYMAGDYLSRTLQIDQECRRKMIAWFYEIVDYCRFGRETVEISVNYLDRFLSSSDAVSAKKLTRKDFKLIAMTCLFVAIKIHESIVVLPMTIAGLSGGKFSGEDIVACERRLLSGLGWRVNPPTTTSFVWMRLRDAALSHFVELQVLQLTKIQLEAAVQDYSIMTSVLPSVLADAALSNSMRSIGCYNDDKLYPSVDVVVAETLVHTLPAPLLHTSVPIPVLPKRESLVISGRKGKLSPTSRV